MPPELVWSLGVAWPGNYGKHRAFLSPATGEIEHDQHFTTNATKRDRPITTMHSRVSTPGPPASQNAPRLCYVRIFFTSFATGEQHVSSIRVVLCAMFAMIYREIPACPMLACNVIYIYI